MQITDRLLSFTLLGSEWVLWLLIGLSILSIAVMIERAFFLSSARLDLDGLIRQLTGFVSRGDVSAARHALSKVKGPEARVALAGLEVFNRGPQAISEVMASHRSRERLQMERYLGILGTLGNNAPFIGLFGTVLGIIKAFADLARSQGGGAEVVMAGISEALVATAVGLMVAIPAVIAYNFFQGRVRRILTRTDALAHMVLSAAKGEAEPATASAAAPAGKRDVAPARVPPANSAAGGGD